jgi:hypothetical protein
VWRWIEKRTGGSYLRGIGACLLEKKVGRRISSLGAIGAELALRR